MCYGYKTKFSKKWTSGDWIDHLKYKGMKHSFYKHYSAMSKIAAICHEKCLFLTDGKHWNDREDNIGSGKFAACFSCAKNENVAMWMLYGGIDRCGGMLDFNGKFAKEIINQNREIILGHYENGDCPEICRLKRENENYKIFFADVIYTEEIKSKKSYIFSRQETHEYGVSESVYNGLKGYTKNYAWKYEAECRLCVEINERVFTSLPDHEAINTVIIKLPDGVVGKVVRAPNYHGEIPESVESYKSLLDEKIDWNLCDKCIYREKKQ